MIEPDRVVFGAGAERRVASLLVELGAQRVLLIAQAHHAIAPGPPTIRPASCTTSSAASA